MPSNTAKNWVFTLNNPASTFEADMVELLNGDFARYRFWAGQREVGAEGTEHFQGLLCLASPTRLAWLKRHVSDTAHWEVMRGKVQQALDYCTKDDTRKVDYVPQQWGEAPASQGTRTDLLAVKALIDAGATEATVAEEHFASWVRHHRGFREYKRIKVSPRDWKTEVWVCIGPTGTGKSTLAQAQDEPEKVYWNQGSAWWDGYEQQPVVVLDDYYGYLTYHSLLRLADRYPLMVQTKGGQVQFTPRKMIITSNLLPPAWYPKIAETPIGLSAFYRRVDRWIYLGHSISIASKSYEEFVAALNKHT